MAHLRVEVLPAGSSVYLNDEEKGHSPLVLDVPAGRYGLRVDHQGYQSLQRDVQLIPGQVLLVAEMLHDIQEPVVTMNQLGTSVASGKSIAIRAQATDNEAISFMRLFIDGKRVTEVDSSSLEYTWDTQSAVAGTHVILVEAQDAAGNVGQATSRVEVVATPTLQASPTGKPTPTPTAGRITSPTPQPTTIPAPGVKAYEATITLSAYPYEPYLRERTDPRYSFHVVWLDRAAYEAANLRPQPRTFKAVVLENQYLKLTFLPELGGRLYQCIFKPTGQNIFYQNAVLKPSYWGPLKREENWWLAAGGLEWALPVHEHGYEWGLPWTHSIERQADEAAIVLRDSTANDRVRAEIRVTLSADRAYFVVQPRLVNPTSQPAALQFWLNAALTLGSASTSPNTEFIYPTDRMIVHSTGDGALPGERQKMPWPIVDGRDLSRYGNWRNWLGVFVPEIQKDYVGAYNHETGLGIARVFPPQVAQGLKLFAFGADFRSRSEYADDGSEYFEMWAGPCRTFWPEDEVTLGAGQSLIWSEIWLPFHSIGGMDTANSDVVVKTAVEGSQVRIGIASSRAQRGHAQVLWNAQVLHEATVQLDPQKPALLQIPLPVGASLPGRLGVRLTDANDRTLLEYNREVARSE